MVMVWPLMVMVPKPDPMLVIVIPDPTTLFTDVEGKEGMDGIEKEDVLRPDFRTPF
jgi:hypothetical protein